MSDKKVKADKVKAAQVDQMLSAAGFSGAQIDALKALLKG